MAGQRTLSPKVTKRSTENCQHTIHSAHVGIEPTTLVLLAPCSNPVSQLKLLATWTSQSDRCVWVANLRLSIGSVNNRELAGPQWRTAELPLHAAFHPPLWSVTKHLEVGLLLKSLCFLKPRRREKYSRWIPEGTVFSSRPKEGTFTKKNSKPRNTGLFARGGVINSQTNPTTVILWWGVSDKLWLTCCCYRHSL